MSRFIGEPPRRAWINGRVQYTYIEDPNPAKPEPKKLNLKKRFVQQ
jgi:hypothetical protein